VLLQRCVVSMKCAVSGFGRFMVVQTGEFNSSRWPAVCSWCRLSGGKVVGPKAGYNKTRAPSAVAEGGGRGKYKKDVRSCGVWHVFFLHSLVVVCNGFLQFARVYYGDGSDSYLILDIPTVPHSRLNEPLSTRTV